MADDTPSAAQAKLAAMIESIQEHRRLYLEGDGAAAHMWDSSYAGGPGPIPTLLLTTTGRKSGEPRPQPLIYGKADAGYVVVASKGGAPTHPAWLLNLQANPDVDVQVATEKFRARARVASDDERPELWKLMAGIYPPYDDYQARTARKIPVVVLEPVAG
jgi:deazaflavin-dependent oxidoreductase (nitroreductase family)